MSASETSQGIKCTFNLCNCSFTTFDRFLEHVSIYHLGDDERRPRQVQEIQENPSDTEEADSLFNGMLIDDSLWNEVNDGVDVEDEVRVARGFGNNLRNSNYDETNAIFNDIEEMIREDNQRTLLPFEIHSDTLRLTIRTIPESQMTPPILFDESSTKTTTNILEAIETPTGCYLKWLDDRTVEVHEIASGEEDNQNQGMHFSSEELQQAISDQPRCVPVVNNGSSDEFNTHRRLSSPYWADSSAILKQQALNYQTLDWTQMYCDEQTISGRNSDTMSAGDRSEFIDAVDEREMAFKALSRLSACDAKEIKKFNDTSEKSSSTSSTKAKPHSKSKLSFNAMMKLSLTDLIPKRSRKDAASECSPSKITLTNLLYPCPKGNIRSDDVKSKKRFKRKHSPEKCKPVTSDKTPVYYSYDFLIKEGLKRRNGRTDKPFACPVPDCGKVYKNANGMKYHARYGHSPRQEFPCEYVGCKKIYTTKHGLNAHRKIHPGWEVPKKERKVKKLRIRVPKMKVEQCSSDSDSDSDSHCCTQSSPSPSPVTLSVVPELNETKSEFVDKKPIAEPTRIETGRFRIKLEVNEPIDESLLSHEIMEDESNEEQPVPPSPSFLRPEYVFNSPKKQHPLTKGAFSDVRRKLNFSGNWSVGKEETVDSHDAEAMNSLYFFPQPRASVIPKYADSTTLKLERED